jgi:phage FluMu protein Com
MAARPGPRGAAHVLVPAPAPAEGVAHDCRCGCGSLLARLRPDGVELKCRRCKRVVMLSLVDFSASEGHEVHPIC